MRRRTAQKRRDETGRVVIRGALDRHAAEALYLEVRRLAKRYGAEVRELQVAKRRKRGVKGSA